MFVKEIEIDGFKSYAQTTHIKQFDRHFNAITGLNGSGKSNILDSICFVLGITNLTQVRAANLQELIYKGGNAGITKATVTITFDNRDRDQSPFGYQDYEEITITRQISTGGKHKYLINGQNATANRVSDLFCSVQLNVNNPNFLIMQGKITKVLNMKPIEILSMIEEAAGTKTYDMKKANALSTIDKKNSKLTEIEHILRDDITPMIEKLKLERSAYIEYQKCEREYLHLQKISVAYRFSQYEESLVKIQNESNQLTVNLENNHLRIEQINELISELKEEINELRKNIGDKDEPLNEHEAKLKECQIEIAKLKSELNSFESNIKSEKKRKTQIDKSINENNGIIVKREQKLADMNNSAGSSKTAFEQAEIDLKAAEKNYEAICCGFELDNDNMLGSIQDQLINVSNKISELSSQIKQSELKMKNATSETQKLNKEINVSTKDYNERLEDFNKKKEIYERSKSEVDKMNYDSKNYENIQTQKRELSYNINGANDTIQVFYSKFPQLNFEYKIQDPNFDHSGVKGLVCNLFRIKDPMYATALEIAAGGKLYQLVVNSTDTGKALLESGSLKRKITIIPMNKIKSNVISDRQVRTAKDLVGHDSVFSALSLIDYAPEYSTVMEYVFGSKLICISLDAAKTVAFHPQVFTSTITLEGDQFDPEGILSGGSKSDRANILIKIAEYNHSKDELVKLGKKMNDLEGQLNVEKLKVSQYSKLKRELDEVESRMNTAKTNLEQTSYHQKLEKLESLNQEITTRQADIQVFNQELVVLKEKHAQLSDKVKNGTNKEEEKLKAQKIIDEKKKFIEDYLKKNNQFQQEFDLIQGEINALKEEIVGYNEEITKIEENINAINQQKEETNNKITDLQKNEAEIQVKIDERKQVIKEKNFNMSKKSSECDKLEKEKNTLELNNKEINHKKSNFTENLAQAQHQLHALVEANDWINDEKTNFGVPNSAYDFKKQNIKELNHRLNEIKNRKEKLSKQVDMRAMGMLAKKEEEYEDLTKKRTIVLKDRSTLESTIEDLEKVKCEVLRKAFDSINKDLGRIFATLLPGAFAKLESVNKTSLLEGVEFKVAFGDVWKESLTELSGGQRSLVALSLILSLLLFKPAPLYILDEVDAALDTSHTQNIGLMIKKYFKASQFIIVSLKDGMYTNANVLFRTRLIDGVSTIERFDTTNKKNQNEKSDQNNGKTK